MTVMALAGMIGTPSRSRTSQHVEGFLLWRVQIWIIQTAQTTQCACLGEPPANPSSARCHPIVTTLARPRAAPFTQALSFRREEAAQQAALVKHLLARPPGLRGAAEPVEGH